MSDMPTNANSSIAGWIDNFFKLKQKNTSIKTEFLAGLTTFFSMAYIILLRIGKFLLIKRKNKNIGVNK